MRQHMDADAPGAHHLMFADLVEVCCNHLRSRSGGLEEFQANPVLFTMLAYDPVPMDVNSWPQWECEEDIYQECSAHLRATFPAMNGMVIAHFRLYASMIRQVATLEAVEFKPFTIAAGGVA